MILMVGVTDPSGAASAARETVLQFEGLLLDYVGRLLSEMDDGLFLLSSGGGGSNGEVGDGREDGGGVEQGLVVAGGRDPLRQGVCRVASSLSSLSMMVTAAAEVNAYLHRGAILLPHCRIHDSVLL
jgi:hypothetical protein